jgi:hypothetical protein
MRLLGSTALEVRRVVPASTALEGRPTLPPVLEEVGSKALVEDGKLQEREGADAPGEHFTRARTPCKEGRTGEHFWSCEVLYLAHPGN